MKRSWIKRGTGFKRPEGVYSSFKPRKVALGKKKRVAGQISGKKVKNKGYQVPAWFKSLPLGSHGQTPAQKKYWKVVSDHVRKSDFEMYGGKCVTCPTRLERWQDGQCAHYNAWSVCHGFFKFELKNLALSCANCNRLSDGAIGTRFGKELQRRHGENILDWIAKENLKHKGEKMEVWEIVARVEALSTIPT